MFKLQYQIKQVTKQEVVEFWSNMEKHYEHTLIQVQLNRSQDHSKTKHGMPKWIKTAIEPFIRNGVKNMKIVNHLRDIVKVSQKDMPSSEQLTRFRSYYKSKRINEISVKDRAHFVTWSDEHQINADLPNDLIVINYKLKKDELIFVLSSLRLLMNANVEDQYHEGYICIDSTFKLMTCKFPLAIISTRDKRRKLKNIAFAILSNETIENYKFVIESLKTFIQKELKFQWNIKVQNIQ